MCVSRLLFSLFFLYLSKFAIIKWKNSIYIYLCLCMDTIMQYLFFPFYLLLTPTRLPQKMCPERDRLQQQLRTLSSEFASVSNELQSLKLTSQVVP